MAHPFVALLLCWHMSTVSWSVAGGSQHVTAESLPELESGTSLDDLDINNDGFGTGVTGDEFIEHTDIPVPTMIEQDDIQNLLNSFDHEVDPEHCDESPVDNSIPVDTVIDEAPTGLFDHLDVHSLNQVWENSLFQSVWSLNVSKPALPWERGSASMVFGNAVVSMPSFVVPQLPLLPKADVSANKRILQVNNPHTVSSNSWRIVARRIANLPWKESEEKSRAYALARWRTIIQSDANSFAIGKQIMEDVFNLCSDEYLVNSIDDIFAMKSTKTLLKRSADMIRFISWNRQQKLEPFPMIESVAYRYIREKCMQFASTASSFRESVAFSCGMLELAGTAEVLASARIRGLCNRTKASKRPLQQARVLTCKQVKQLEHLVLHASDIQDKVMAGYCLLCLNARARWSDIQFPVHITVDKDHHLNGFYQIDVRLTKTSSTAEKKAMLLPVTGILDGLSNNKWFDSWETSRKESGLCTNDKSYPLMPGVLVNGKWDKAPLSTSQASKWLRELLLNAGSSVSSVERISTHSLKATTLSWASKHGMLLADRTLLGYHVLQGASSTLHYSRDSLSGPLRKMQDIYEQIRREEFDPDNTRSGYFSFVKRTVMDVKSSEDDSSSSSSSSDSDSDGAVMSDEERAATANASINSMPNVHKRKKLAVLTDQQSLFIHKRWKTLHLAESNTAEKLKCGRHVTAAFVVVVNDQTFPYVRCKDCFGNDA